MRFLVFAASLSLLAACAAQPPPRPPAAAGVQRSPARPAPPSAASSRGQPRSPPETAAAPAALPSAMGDAPPTAEPAAVAPPSPAVQPTRVTSYRVRADGVVGCADAQGLRLLNQLKASAGASPRLVAQAHRDGRCMTAFTNRLWTLEGAEGELVRLRLRLSGAGSTVLWFVRGDVTAAEVP